VLLMVMYYVVLLVFSFNSAGKVHDDKSLTKRDFNVIIMLVQMHSDLNYAQRSTRKNIKERQT
jgi:hypothetical protein